MPLTSEQIEVQRWKFESVISASPFCKRIAKFPSNESSAWPNSYKDIDVDLAWQIWLSAIESVEIELPKIITTEPQLALIGAGIMIRMIERNECRNIISAQGYKVKP